VATSEPPPSRAAAPSPTLAPKPPQPSPIAKQAAVPTPLASAPTRAETPSPSASPSRRTAILLEPTPEPVASASPAPAREGLLQLLVVPWAEVFVGGKSMGTTPMKPIGLSEGAHTVRFVHPEYHPLQKRVNVRAGETVRLEVDLKQEGFPKVQE
jgi:hypothetical protein